jgi:ubiquinone/menaquinone biosynthesis C-methylase UbiE
VGRYNSRARGYETGRLGRWHADIVERTAALTGTCLPEVGRALDVGCGSGALVRTLERIRPHMTFFGIDPAAEMLARAVGRRENNRSNFLRGYAEALPVRDAVFDVVVTSVSFGHWANQQQGLDECRRVLVEGGPLVLVDVFARWLNLATRRGTRHSAHTKGRTTELLLDRGFTSVEWHDVYGHVVGGLVAR